ncbi:DUF4239 domain-containing protein [Castellaniella defragrans]|jgi:hypothetical protein|nr:DUF4239 domain-containing protein [Castellaniella defragrans]
MTPAGRCPPTPSEGLAVFDFMYDLPEWAMFVSCVLLVGGLSAAALALMYALRRLWPPGSHGPNMVNTMLSGILLPTGMVITFVAADIWQQDAKGRTAVEKEAVAVADTMRVVKFLPADLREQVTGVLDDYIREVVENEWPLMGEGRASQIAEDQLETLMVISVRIEAGTDGLGVQRAAEALRRYTMAIEKARNQRLLVSHSRVMPTKWIAVLVLLFVAACVLSELHMTQRRPLILSLTLFSLGFGATLYLIASFDRPFTGTTIIEPTSLSVLLVRG